MVLVVFVFKLVKDLDIYLLLFLFFGRSFVEFVMLDVFFLLMNEDIVWDWLDFFFYVVMNVDLEYI